MKKALDVSVVEVAGGYRDLQSFQVSQIVYDATVVFCDRFFVKGSRMTQQMVHAARSGKQNIAEGSAVSGTSRKSELMLTNVARASLEELLLDYEDFLRQRKLKQWKKDDDRTMEIRNLAQAPDRCYATYADHVENRSAQTAANTLLCLVHQTSYLLRRQIAQLEARFLEEGDFGERLYNARRRHRSRP